MRKVISMFVVFFLSSMPVICGARTLEELARQLQSPNAALRLETVRDIGINYTNAGFEYLVQASSDPDDCVRERAVQGLGLSGNPAAAVPLMKAVKDQDEFVRWRAVQALHPLGVQDINEEDIASLIRDESWRVRVGVFELLGATGGKVGETFLLRGLEDPDERVRLAAASALAGNKDQKAFNILVDLLRNGSMFSRAEAATAIGNIDDPATFELLIQAMTDPGNSDDQEGSNWARWGAVLGLVKLTGQDFGLDVEKWRQWRKTHKPR